MENTAHHFSYADLGALIDRLLDECGDDIGRLCELLEGLPAAVRDELLVSDLLNAFQTFYFFFREIPGDIRMERLTLTPASELTGGVLVDEIELLELIFVVAGNEPVMIVSDGRQVLASFCGKAAYREALSYIESTL
jgi:hypothetical protein